MITEIELLSFRDPNSEDEQLIRQKSKGLRRIELDSDVIRQSSFLRSQYRFKIPDSIVVASSMVSNSFLITNDQKSCPRIKAIHPYFVLPLTTFASTVKECRVKPERLLPERVFEKKPTIQTTV